MMGKHKIKYKANLLQVCKVKLDTAETIVLTVGVERFSVISRSVRVL